MMFKLDDNHYRKSQRSKAKSIILEIKKNGYRWQISIFTGSEFLLFD